MKKPATIMELSKLRALLTKGTKVLPSEDQGNSEDEE
jgi:hypothetical protein